MNVLGVVTGSLLCIGCILGYIPQFYNIIKFKSVKGISEFSLVLMNIGTMCLTMNSIIFSWSYFSCHDLPCLTDLFPFIQIFLSWIMVLIYYIIFIVYKFYNNKHKIEKSLLAGSYYIITYLIFTIFVIALALGEKMENHSSFFHLFADILGYTSAVLNSIVFLPQIYTIYSLKSKGNLSFIMFLMQTPGNLVIIVFQAVLYNSPVSTWITYVIILAEQSIILFLMIYYYFRYPPIEIMNGEEIHIIDY